MNIVTCFPSVSQFKCCEANVHLSLQPLRHIGLRRTTIRKERDSLLMDSQNSTGDLHSTIISITETNEDDEEDETKGNTLYLALKDKEDKVCQHL